MKDPLTIATSGTSEWKVNNKQNGIRKARKTRHRFKERDTETFITLVQTHLVALVSVCNYCLSYFCIWDRELARPIVHNMLRKRFLIKWRRDSFQLLSCPFSCSFRFLLFILSQLVATSQATASLIQCSLSSSKMFSLLKQIQKNCVDVSLHWLFTYLIETTEISCCVRFGNEQSQVWIQFFLFESKWIEKCMHLFRERQLFYVYIYG